MSTRSERAEKNPFDPALFEPEAVSAETRAFVDDLIEQSKARSGPLQGDAMPTQPQSARARTVATEGLGGGHVPLRILEPDAAPTGVYLHIHAGGLVMGSADAQDPMYERIIAATGQAVVSVEYRLAPEHPISQGVRERVVELPPDSLAAIWSKIAGSSIVAGTE